MHEKRNFIILSFDVESDFGSWTQTYAGNDNAIPQLLELLSHKQVRATFLCTAKAALHNKQMLKQIVETGHEVGCHGYQHDTLGEASYEVPGVRTILPEEVSSRIVQTSEIIKDITVIKPLSFRAPRLWGSSKIIQILEKNGYLVDSTYDTAKHHNLIVPYHPSSTNWLHPGSSQLLEIPTAGTFGSMISDDIRRFKKVLRYGNSISQWPILRLYGADAFISYLASLIKKQHEKCGISVICVYFHPWEFWPMPSKLSGIEANVELAPYLYENCGGKTLLSLKNFISHFKRNGFHFSTMKDFYYIWKNITLKK